MKEGVPIVIAIVEEGHLLERIVATKRDGQRIDDPAMDKAGDTDDDKKQAGLRPFGRVTEKADKACRQGGHGVVGLQIERGWDESCFVHVFYLTYI